MSSEPRTRPLALVVDDDLGSRAVLATVAERQGFDIALGSDGREAVESAKRLRPDLIFLDVDMPRLDGLAALEEIRESDAHVPVVVVSAVDEPEVAEKALELGAVNFVSKPFDIREIRFVVDRIRAAIREEADLRSALPYLVERHTALEFGNDPAILSRVVAFLGRELRLHYPGSDIPLTEPKLALYEALANAVEHGNLEIDYDDKTRALEQEGTVSALIERRRRDARFRDRKVRIDASYGRTKAVWTITDEGRGFHHQDVEETRRLGDTSALHGRGILLMKHYMSEVVWNDVGNKVRLVLEIPWRGDNAQPSSGDGRS